MADYVIQIASESQFDRDILSSQRPALVHFFAFWCPDSRRLRVTLRNLAHDHANDADIFELDVDELPQLVEKYHADQLPTAVLFHAGHELHRWVGDLDPAHYADVLTSLLAGR